MTLEEENQKAIVTSEKTIENLRARQENHDL